MFHLTTCITDHNTAKYVPARNMPKLPDMHLSEKYSNIHATYEAALINNVIIIAAHGP